MVSGSLKADPVGHVLVMPVTWFYWVTTWFYLVLTRDGDDVSDKMSVTYV